MCGDNPMKSCNFPLAERLCYIHFLFTLATSDRVRSIEMAQITCIRCGNVSEAIQEPLYLGRLESQVKAQICPACWAEWVKMRVMVINEYQVNLGDESGRALVKEQMFTFLKLPKPEQQPQ
jgi:Fe-S cluster biosynthesis and repair protein YggX